jgi:hypothetical protein
MQHVDQNVGTGYRQNLKGSPARQARSMARLGREPERNILKYLSTGSADQTEPAAGIGGRRFLRYWASGTGRYTVLRIAAAPLLAFVVACGAGADDGTAGPDFGTGGFMFPGVGGGFPPGMGGQVAGTGGGVGVVGAGGIGNPIGAGGIISGGAGTGGIITGGSGAGGVIVGGAGSGGLESGGAAGVGTGGAPVVTPGGSEADYRDPGTGPWEQVTPEQCGLDSTRFADSSVATYAVFRYGKMCHRKGADTAGAMYSATKTLGGTMAGRAAYLTRDIPRAGPGTGTILHEDKATDWLGTVSYNREATLSHVMAMCGHNANLAYGSKSFSYDTIGSVQINTMIAVVERAIGQVPGLGTSAVGFVQQQIFAKLGMGSSSWSPALGISTGWTANLSDMGKLGTLLVHDGWYGGERLLAREWVYRMSHPAFEDANTSYGQLAWLNHRGNAAGIGGNITSGANAPQGDPCAPAAFWPDYPHGISGAPDCRATVGTCEQKYDVGVFSAQGLNGQFLVMHPGLDLVIVARNFSGGDGPLGLWRAVRPALVAMDPVYKGNEAAFCADYGAGNYAPDLVMARHP